MSKDSELSLLAWHEMLLFQRKAEAALDGLLKAERGISLDIFQILSQLNVAPGRKLRMGDLASQIGVAPSSCTRLVDTLVATELVSRATDPASRRSILVAITAEGRAALKRSVVVYQTGVDAVFAGLRAQDLKHLHEILGRVVHPN